MVRETNTNVTYADQLLAARDPRGHVAACPGGTGWRPGDREEAQAEAGQGGEETGGRATAWSGSSPRDRGAPHRVGSENLQV